MEENANRLSGFGARLTAAIAAANTTASQLARELNLTPQAIYNYEMRDGGITAATLFRIADLLHTDATWLGIGKRPRIMRNPHEAPALSTFGGRLDGAMRRAGFKSQNALSSASGVPQATISRILSDSGTSGPELETVRKLAAPCLVSVAWLSEGIDDSDAPYVLSSQQADWLDLLDDLGSDDLVEFGEAIKKRQKRNRKLFDELSRRSSPR